MRSALVKGGLLACAALALLALPRLVGVRAQSSASTPLPVMIHTDQPGTRVSPDLFGVFFEEINHAGDGGLYAELVRNRTFKEMRDGKPVAWSVEGDAVALSLDNTHPLNEANPTALRVEVKNVPASGRAGVLNTGYWGISVKKGARYDLRLYARADSDKAVPLTATLETDDGKVLAHATLSAASANWDRKTARLTPDADATRARLVIASTQPGVFYLNVVSLFPQATYKNRPNGLRPDLAEKVAALKPAFLRFPGGCYVEGGDLLKNRFQWKNTVTDIAARPGHLNDTWHYWSTDGLGYHEYLQLCEDIQATPLFVVNCGFSHKEIVPMDKLGPYLQEALDAIEYANGPVTSKWGALRAKNGHPKPFGLKYVEIGNENGLWDGFGGVRADYTPRYKVFYDAIKAKYPDIVTIADTRVSAPMEVVDDHFYNSPGWFWQNVHMYDNADRKGPKIYVGEYAVTSDAGQGNLRAALAEAAWMTGMERNSEIVTMASYAPLFVHVQDRAWNPDAICFDSSRSYGTPSYYVQEMFARSRIETLLPVDFPNPPRPVEAKGKIGLGTWNTQAEFKDITVTAPDGTTLYTADPAKDGDKWKSRSGQWAVADGAWRQNAPGTDRRNILEIPALVDAGDYTIHLKARRTGGDEGFLVLFHVKDRDNYYWWNVGGWGNTQTVLEKSVAGNKISFGPRVQTVLENGRWYDVKITLEGSHIRCNLDDKLLADVTDTTTPALAASAGRASDGAVIVKFVNGTDSPVQTDLNLAGASSVAATGTETVLTSDSGSDENTLSAPTRVAPVSRPLTGVTPRFAHTFPAHSLTILRLQTVGTKTAATSGNTSDTKTDRTPPLNQPTPPNNATVLRPIKNAVPYKARPLPLTAVRLTGGPLKHAQDLDAKYLLELDPDRIMAHLRQRAGLPTEVQGYGGWEGGGRNLTGHIAGHYLSAVSLMYAATGDVRFKERADRIVADLKEVQDKNGDGYLGALQDKDGVDGEARFKEVAAGKIRSGGFDLNGLWSPWYVEHKIYAGLRDAYRYTGNRTALDVEIKFAAWAKSIVGGLDDAQDQQMLNTEFGGMNEVLADLYADTGDPQWLTLSDRFQHRAVLDPLARQEDHLGGLHGNAQIPKLIGSLARYIYTGDKKDGTAASFFWDAVVYHHSFATGGHGKDEYFGPADALNNRVDGRTDESCNVYNMLKLTRGLFALNPDPKYAEFEERALFNHVLGSIDPEDGRTCYMVPVGRGVRREYQDMFGGFTCCVGTGMENHALHGAGIYYEAGDRLWVNLYAPSTAEWASTGVTLTMDTTFPEGDSATLRLKLRASKAFTLSLRRPLWAGEGFTVAVNGQAVKDVSAPGTFVDLQRTWKDGDTVTLKLPKVLHTEPLPDNPRRVALLWGPLVLAGDLGPEDRGGIHPTPVFVSAEKPLTDWLKPIADKPGDFHSSDVGRNSNDGKPLDVNLVPFYRLHRRIYSAYWDLYTPSEWEKKAAEVAREQERHRKLEAATVGYAQPGEMQPERDFNQQGEDSYPTRVQGRPGRNARKWFSFDLPVDPLEPMTLIVTYNAHERRPRTFTILVDGKQVAEQTVRPTPPGDADAPPFFEVSYILARDLTKDKKKVTIRFEATEGNETASIFGIRTVRTGAIAEGTAVK